MKKLIVLLGLFLFFNTLSFAQKKSNPIIYIETMFGYSNGGYRGLTGGGNLNYQYKNNLFTVRYLEFTNSKNEGVFIIIPVYTLVERIKEYGMLYGKRIVEGNTSYSYSAGISLVERKFLDETGTTVLKYNISKAIGFPFELNVKWFNSKKERYRIYEIIPVGKPTAFSNSIGFKFYGDISKKSFVGIGITFGFGWHKIY